MYCNINLKMVYLTTLLIVQIIGYIAWTDSMISE
jgi:hypothetical protein